MSCSDWSNRPTCVASNGWRSSSLWPVESPTSGAEPVRLTTDGTLKLAPVFMNNGDEVAFATHEIPNLVSIVCLKLSDGSRRRLHPTAVNHQFDPAFSRDGRYHAFGRSSTSPQMVLVIQDSQEKKDAVFQPRESRATARNPSFAPDGSRVVFSLSDIGGHQIVSVNPQGKELKHLTSAAGMNAWPAYSPDGRKIAFRLKPERRFRDLCDECRRVGYRPPHPEPGHWTLGPPGLPMARGSRSRAIATGIMRFMS